MSGAADPAGPPTDLLAAVVQAYGLASPVRAKQLTGGYANDVFLLKGEQSVVLHVKHPPLDMASLGWEHHLLQRLSRVLPEIPSPMRTLDGRTFLLHQNQPVWLTPYFPGYPAGPADRGAVATALGRLHSVNIDVIHRPGRLRLSDLTIPPVRQMPSAFDNWLPVIHHARSEAIELIEQIAKTRSITAGVTHNDILPGSVLVHEGSVSALLDWEEADLDWLVWDLAASIGPYCSTSDGALDRGAASEFVDSYRKPAVGFHRKKMT